MAELKNAVRQYLAWKSVWEESEQLNLDPFQKRQADTKCKNADKTVQARIPESWQWLLVPEQPDTKGAVEWQEIRLQGSEALSVRACKKLKTEELLLTQMGGVRLRMELDRVPLWRGDDVPVKQLMEDFATYLYLPRLRDSNVLLGAIRDGVLQPDWQKATFAYAQAKNEIGRYQGLVDGLNTSVQAEGGALVVKPEVAAEQHRKDAEEAGKKAEAAASGGGSEANEDVSPSHGSGSTDFTHGATPPPVPPAPKPKELRRFHGSVNIDALRVGRDAGRIADEVIQHLTKLIGADVQVTIEIQANLQDGASEKTIRDVSENCRTLNFSDYGFEEE